MRAALQRDIGWLVFNGLAICVYLALASKYWTSEPEAFDLAVSRSVTELPLALVVAASNTVWLIVISRRIAARRGTAWSMAVLLLAFATWVAAYLIDRSHWGPAIS
jgi:hypothetical protein